MHSPLTLNILLPLLVSNFRYFLFYLSAHSTHLSHSSPTATLSNSIYKVLTTSQPNLNRSAILPCFASAVARAFLNIASTFCHIPAAFQQAANTKSGNTLNRLTPGADLSTSQLHVSLVFTWAACTDQTVSRFISYFFLRVDLFGFDDPVGSLGVCMLFLT